LTLVLLDTNVYLRLAKRVRPLLGVPFGADKYVITILKDVENEVHRNSKLTFYNPWFDAAELVNERLAKQVRLTESDKRSLNAAQSTLHGIVKGDMRYLVEGRSPPGLTDCRVLAFSQIRIAIIVTDDLGMHLLASEVAIPVWHGYELLVKMRSAEMITDDLIREIYEALENNNDMTKSWRIAKHTIFAEIFGEIPPT
jgi:hypothetical protein